MMAYLQAYQFQGATQFEKIDVSAPAGLHFLSGELEVNPESPFYPDRSDLKIMRHDVIAAIITANEMLEPYDRIKRENLDLFVASGAFVENVDKQMGHILKTYEKFAETDDETEKMFRIYRASPPLLALQTLTNAAMSFIAQYTGIKGNNATFGNTSISGYHAILEGLYASETNQEGALVCASNTGGPHSFLMNYPFYQQKEGWKESAAVGTLFLSSKPSFVAITGFASQEHATEVIGITRNWLNLRSDDRADFVIHSGAFTEEVAQTDQNYLSSTGAEVYSTFNKYGNMGAANVLVSLCLGAEKLKSGAQIVDVFDRDIYGRESWLRIEKTS